MTGPLMINILAPRPSIQPSVLNSRAGAATELAKPVIGTRVPAPACFASFSYQPSAVKNAERNISVTETASDAVFCSSPSDLYRSSSDCPSRHISPPKKNAFGINIHF